MLYLRCDRTTKRHDNKMLLYTTAKILTAYVSARGCKLYIYHKMVFWARKCVHIIWLFDVSSAEQETLKESTLLRSRRMRMHQHAMNLCVNVMCCLQDGVSQNVEVEARTFHSCED